MTGPIDARAVVMKSLPLSGKYVLRVPARFAAAKSVL